jgi:ornithine cyclodeaminase/alanine dehydrogenase-like protein (mu-crystallin family)
MDAPPLRYLSAADVMKAMPDVEERLELAVRTMLALANDSELPPKIGVHPRPIDSFAHAMPAWMRGLEADGSGDLLGTKWVVGFPANADRGIPAIHGTVLLSDATTGLPRAVLDAGPITAHRTAAVSGAAIARWGPLGDGAARVAVLGAGVQARSHLTVIAHLLPGASLTLCDRDSKRLEALAADARVGANDVGRFAEVSTTSDLIDAVRGADLIVTLVSFGPHRQVVPADAFGEAATIVAVDYDMCVPASVADGAALFLTDDRAQFLANRTATMFVGYPEPESTIGEAIAADTPRPAGRVLISHLGIGLADVVFGDAVLRAAEAAGIGTVLKR